MARFDAKLVSSSSVEASGQKLPAFRARCSVWSYVRSSCLSVVVYQSCFGRRVRVMIRAIAPGDCVVPRIGVKRHMMMPREMVVFPVTSEPETMMTEAVTCSCVTTEPTMRSAVTEEMVARVTRGTTVKSPWNAVSEVFLEVWWSSWLPR